MSAIFSKSYRSSNKAIDKQYLSHPSLISPALLDQLSSTDLPQKYANFLARKVRQEPQNLDLHSRRIKLNFSLKNEEAYFGALIDLFITLGPKGLALKKTVLRRTYRLLSKEHKAIIKQHLHSGINANQPIAAPESRLLKGASSNSLDILRELKNAYTARKNNSLFESFSVTQQMRYKAETNEPQNNLNASFELLTMRLSSAPSTPNNHSTDQPLFIKKHSSNQ